VRLKVESLRKRKPRERGRVKEFKGSRRKRFNTEDTEEAHREEKMIMA